MAAPVAMAWGVPEKGGGSAAVVPAVAAVARQVAGKVALEVDSAAAASWVALAVRAAAAA
jgi:hypothetical protein